MQRLFDTADGAVFVGAHVAQVDLLLDALGARDLDELPAAFAARRTDEVTDTLRALDIGVHRVEPSGGLLAPDGIAAVIGLRIEDHSEEHGSVVMSGPVARLSRTPLVAGPLAPPFGAHSEEIRLELGSP